MIHSLMQLNNSKYRLSTEDAKAESLLPVDDEAFNLGV